MKMGRRWMLGGWVLALLLPLAGASAQEGGLIIAASDPRAPGFSQDLYRWDEGTRQLERLSEDGMKRLFKLAPDGSRIAYCITPASVREAVRDGYGELASVVCDIEVYDVATGTRRLVAGQPENMTLVGAEIRHGISRAGLVWSPDSTLLAWTEQDYPAAEDGGRRLVIHDLARSTTRVLDEALPRLALSEDGLPSQVAWGQAGLVVFTNDPGEGQPGVLRWYDPWQGLRGVIQVGVLQEPWFNRSERRMPPTNGPLWVRQNAAEFLILQWDDRWFQVDLWAETLEPFWLTVELVSAIQPDESLRVVWVPTSSSNLDFRWEIWSPAGESLYTWNESNFGAAANIAIAPAGDAIAFKPDVQSVAIWRSTGLTPLDPGDFTSLMPLWGPVLWRVSSIVLDPGWG